MLSHELIARYGVLIVFLNVFGSSLGLPLPAAPTLLMIGASMSLAAGDLSSTIGQCGVMLGAAVTGGALGDLVWFLCGKRYGARALCSACKLSVGRHACIAHMERFFGRYGVRILVIARFVPGLSFVSVPLCGATAIRWRPFVLHDCAGLGPWASVTLTTGAMFASQIDHTVPLLWRFCWQALGAIALALVLYAPFRYFRRVLRERARARSTAGARVINEPPAARLAAQTRCASPAIPTSHRLMRSRQHCEPAAVATATRRASLR
ncbi:DedA family protein [Paraburkholderia dilworthii]|uniref:DedA family protein n=1 Tax=Paraburkholderia dilworthii TaxID=948106 RepID=UPI0003FF976B|nr:DedA family protein [Paraburkholderia dilworthii]